MTDTTTDDAIEQDEAGERRLNKIAWVLLGLLMLLGLMFRPRGDDLWYLSRLGFDGVHRPDAIDFMRHVVYNWHGRYSTLATQTLLGTVEPLATMLFPAVFLALFAIVLRGCLKAAGLPHLRWLVPVWLVAWVLATPGAYDSLYSLCAAVVYDTPLLWAAVAAWCVLRWDMRDRSVVAV